MRRLHLICTCLTIGALTVFASAPTAQSDSISIDCTGLHMTYDGCDIFDADDSAGGNGSVAEATALGSITCSLDGVPVWSSSSGDNLYADVFVEGVPEVPANGYSTSRGGLYVDLLSDAGPLLQLRIDQVYVTYTTDGATYNSVAVIGNASAVTSQNLPGGLIIDPGKQINISLLGDNFDTLTTGDQGQLIGFEGSSGTGQINGTAVPEPGTLALLLCMATSALAARRLFWK